MSKQVDTRERKLLEIVGPGILYAAAAVGVSHLVQATRAGAYYGLGLALVVIIACLLKYPALRFGGIYAAATKTSLISSYRKDGWFVFAVYGISQVFSMVFVTAALSLFTTGLIQVAFGVKVNNIVAVSALLAFVIVMLVTGKYNVMEKVTKVIVATFTVMITVATALVIPKIQWSFSALVSPEISIATIPFLLALMGFMPTPAEGSVLQSLWTCARIESLGKITNQKNAAIDFNFGFGITIVLAICFLLLGAGVMHSAGVEVVKSNFGFSRQLMELFTKTIGGWSFPIIAIAAISVMFSTMYTVLDGYTRIAIELVQNSVPNWEMAKDCQKLYLPISVIISVGAVIVLATVMKSFTTFMDLVSIIVFVTSPLIAILNHRAVFGKDMPEEEKPSDLMKMWSYVGIAFLTVCTLVYIYFKFVQ